MRPDPTGRDTVDDLLELYSINALEAHETQLFETALLSLAAAERVAAVERIRATRDAVGRMAVEVAAVPPVHLRARILDALDSGDIAPDSASTISSLASAELPMGEASGQPVPAQPQPTDELAARRLGRRRRIAVAVTSAAAAIILVIGGVFVGRSVLSDPVTDKPAVAQTDSFDELRNVMSAPDAEVHRTEMTGIPGTVVIASSRSMDRAVVLLDDAPHPPQDRAYQLWLIGNDHSPRPAGLVDAAATKTAIVVTDLAGSRTVGMTVEPATGSPQPTGEVVAALPI
ncbi:anti-sigma factor [Williamsia phyllosphaerae]|uniref:Regulator of SigK n=1 Tax=Williamsia phyllosphaerae TaxID=885042 RepID=A0ABQ1UGK4_9NOCA|nr:anti-sigma factor [Williamsia phyllosphaerae]GGF18328.1 anti-sigma-K factor RskA [Williamsia phyllosphaerae]